MIEQQVTTDIFETAMGWVAIAASERGIARTSLPEPTPDEALATIADFNCKTDAGSKAPLNRAKNLLIRYCHGEAVSLNDIPIDDTDWTDYTRRAREACRSIPRGETRTYGWLAEQASGSRTSARAAGRAMATNPVPIIVPCHRVIGSGRQPPRLRRFRRITPQIQIVDDGGGDTKTNAYRESTPLSRANLSIFAGTTLLKIAQQGILCVRVLGQIKTLLGSQLFHFFVNYQAHER